MSSLADALQVLLDRSGIPEDSTERDTITEAIEELRGPASEVAEEPGEPKTKTTTGKGK